MPLIDPTVDVKNGSWMASRGMNECNGAVFFHFATNIFSQDLIKHCPVDHPDHGLLLQALEAMCSLAEKMNRSEESTTNLELLKELEFCFNGLVPGLVAPHRQLVRKDRVSEVIGSQTKDRLMIMLSDVLLCATVRRRTGSKKGVGYVRSPAKYVDVTL